MAIFFDAPVTPDALTAFVRDVPMRPQLRLTELFGSATTLNNTIDFAEIIRTNRTAKYRSYDGRIHVSERDTGSQSRVKLAPLSSSLNMGEYERLQLEFARTGGTATEALANSVYNDGENLTREVQNRLELAWGDVVTDGILTINDEGFIGEADYGMPANHKITAATAWTNIAATILADLIAAVDVYIATNGFPPASMLPSTRIARLMQINTQLINSVKGSAAGASRINRAELQDLFASEGLPQVLDPYDFTLDVDGTATRVIPDDKLVLLPPDPANAGKTVMGLSATALELVNSNESDLSFADAAGIVGVVEKVGPPYRQYTYVDAVGQPVLYDAKQLMVLDVA